MKHLDPKTSNYNMAPGAFNNPDKKEVWEFVKQKTYVEWEPLKTNTQDKIDTYKYDRVKEYDISKEN